MGWQHWSAGPIIFPILWVKVLYFQLLARLNWTFITSLTFVFVHLVVCFLSVMLQKHFLHFHKKYPNLNLKNKGRLTSIHLIHFGHYDLSYNNILWTTLARIKYGVFISRSQKILTLTATEANIFKSIHFSCWKGMQSGIFLARLRLFPQTVSRFSGCLELCIVAPNRIGAQPHTRF